MTERYVIVEGGAVVAVALWDGVSDWPLPDGQAAHPSDVADVGWTYAAGEFTAPAAPAVLPPTSEEWKVLIAARRWLQVQAGTDVDGIHLDTSDTSQVKITGAALEATLDSSYSCDWKSADGTWVTMDAAQILAIARAMRAYIQACYDREKALAAEVDAGTFTDAMLDEGWPA
ncbi:DUF4376 domain-containing protein [Pseudomonas knackmussii]|uniref:DUF4376 domain-containing protein n=1 Tax=Pseudomonas knackmussii TaxID=65741 RepID=UPI0013632F11|nr:DUF4376 domain-containing protein [Pseudomonas knackmussii]